MDRLTLLEQKLMVMQNEINTVLIEVQKAMEGMAKGSKMALDVLAEKIRLLEEGQVRTNTDKGVEL